jgi:quercetin dioxygenase-like cupin family protein
MEKVEHGRPGGANVHLEPGERKLAAPLLQLDLLRELAEVRQGEPYRARGHNAKTLAHYPDLRIVLIALSRGARLEKHQTIGHLSIQLLEGKVAMALDGERVELSAHQLLELAPNRAHDVEALEDSALLLTVAWPGNGTKSAP